MAKIEIIMPKMGESIMEATIIKWLKQEGDKVEMDEAILEIATDKVDSEVPSPQDGVMGKILFGEDEVIEVGTVIAYLHTDGDSPSKDDSEEAAKTTEAEPANEVVETLTKPLEVAATQAATLSSNSNGRFYSPLVLNIAKQEGVTMQELDAVAGSGKDGRVTKRDMLAFVANRSSNGQSKKSSPKPQAVVQQATVNRPNYEHGSNVEIVEMDRMRRLIADHMVMSKQVSPHVTSYVEVDVTNLMNWRNKHKVAFQKQYGSKMTVTHIFIEAVCKAIRDFPLINSSVEGYQQIVKKDVNIGVATALPSGNLIVPVLKNADMLNLAGIVKASNDLIGRARNNQLKPDEVSGGTFTLTNVGSFGNVMGAPIINQPQVAIMSTGIIKKKPVVLETEMGDTIAIRQMMFLSLSYDHRVVDGMLGGSFLRRVGDYLEQFDTSRNI